MSVRYGLYAAVLGFILIYTDRLHALNHKKDTFHTPLRIKSAKYASDPKLSADLNKTFNTFKKKNHISNKNSQVKETDAKSRSISQSGAKGQKEFSNSEKVSETTALSAKRQYIYGVPSSVFPQPALIPRRLVAYPIGLHRGACLHHVCYHGGVCVRTQHGFYCDCPQQYIGAHCEFKRVCLENPCKNAGTCTELGQRDFTCTCPVGSKGKTCELKDLCIPNPCANEAICTELDEGYHCTCKLGHKGDRCQKKARCFPNPCKNGATCIDRDSEFECSCALGFKGDLCEVLSECKNAPCVNGGTCVEMAVGYRCACLKGFVGKNCEANLCNPNPCANDGKCSVSGDHYDCACPKHYTGKHCEVLNACHTNPCLNGGECVASQSSSGYTNDGFTCKCSRGYYGNMCQMK